MRTLAMLSMHTSPLSQPGAGDSGGMNVYVRELAHAAILATLVSRPLEDLDDVQNVFANFDVPDDVLAQLDA